MHTLTKRPLTQENFAYNVPEVLLSQLNYLILEDTDLLEAKNLLPEGFLQRRIVCASYKSLRNIYWQRAGHKLREWELFREYFETIDWKG
jgi:hypothetical protein